MAEAPANQLLIQLAAASHALLREFAAAGAQCQQVVAHDQRIAMPDPGHPWPESLVQNKDPCSCWPEGLPEQQQRRKDQQLIEITEPLRTTAAGMDESSQYPRRCEGLHSMAAFSQPALRQLPVARHAPALNGAVVAQEHQHAGVAATFA